MIELKKKLKPCPFCGGEAMIEKMPKWSSFNIECSECASCGAITQTQEGAIEAWNKRYGEEEEDDRRPISPLL